MRRFNDPIGLGREGYPALLFLSLFAWHTYHSKNVDARSVVREVVVGSEWRKRVVVSSVLGYLDSAGYLHFQCQSPIWRPGGWRMCPRDWDITVAGYARLQQLLANLGLTVNDILQQPNPHSVKTLLDDRIRQIYRELWSKIKKYEDEVSKI
jgi:hypothetical protein